MSFDPSAVLPGPPFDLAEADRLLSTTRSVRKRLDLERPVEREVLLECVRLAQQAPTGSNTQAWRWVFATEPGQKLALAELYRSAIGPYLDLTQERAPARTSDDRILDSATHLANNLEHVPVLAVPCIEMEVPEDDFVGAAGVLASIIPSVWSFQLALRARGLGSCYTTFHLRHADKAAEVLGLPPGVVQVALLPVAYTIGTDFKPAQRPPAETIVHWERWGARDGAKA